MNGLETAGVGTLMVFGLGALVLCVLSVIAMWLIFEKAGKPGWHSLIPILNTYDLYDICWEGKYGLITIGLAFLSGFVSSLFKDMNGTGAVIAAIFICVICILAIVIEVKFALKLAKTFGKSTVFAIGLLFFTPIFDLILGLGSARYLGKENKNNRIEFKPEADKKENENE